MVGRGRDEDRGPDLWYESLIKISLIIDNYRRRRKGGSLWIETVIDDLPGISEGSVPSL